MTWLGRIWTRIKRRRRISAAKADQTPLREFVYLDEVSVYSLLASRKGPLATEYTDTQENALSTELASTIGGNAGVAKASTSSKLATTQTQTMQVLRKSTIQAAFKELHEGEEGKLAISPISPKSSLPNIANWKEFEDAVEGLVLDGEWVIDPNTLTRGRLFEVAIELEPDRVFRMTSIISEMKNIVLENRQLFPAPVYSEVQKMAAVNRVLDSLLVGLIPLRCRVVDYRVVDLKGKKLLVHRQLLARLPSASGHKVGAVYTAGVTEQRLFWKDVRRVLFSGLQFHAMCRANRNGLQDTWVPVKLFDVLRDVIPDLAGQIDEMVRSAFTAQDSAKSLNSDIMDRMKEALISYGLSLAEYQGGHVNRGDVLEVAAKVLSTEADYSDIEVRREAFGAITQYVTEALSGDAVDPMLAAQLRTTAMIEAGMGLSGVVTQVSTSGYMQIDKETSSILDTEIVAIYW